MIQSDTATHTGNAVPFAFVDVFATRALTGAPLSLVTDADSLTDSQMRALAREFNQSETTFLLSPSVPGATRRLRSFTPTGEEVLGAGHNALGAWLWLASSGQLSIDGDGDGDRLRFTQQIGDAVLPVQVIHRPGQPILVSMDQAPPQFGSIVADRGELAIAVGLDEDELVADQPAQVVSTGAGHLMVPVRNRRAVDRAVPDAAKLTAVLQQVGGEGCYLYTRETIEADATAYTRFFNPAMGIWEDAATGTAAGPLIALLVAAGAVADDSTCIIEQGHALGRPSRIAVTVTGDRVRVSGSGVIAAHGTITV
jgi:trans-2,3-dihydro-3-hydroxyanthranilate isomerase